jgi:hypothetical protein
MNMLSRRSAPLKQDPSRMFTRSKRSASLLGEWYENKELAKDMGCTSCRENTKTKDTECKGCQSTCTCPDCQYVENEVFATKQAVYPLHTPKTLSETMKLLPFLSTASNPMNGPYCSMRAVSHLLKRLNKDPVLAHLQVCTVKDGDGLNTSVTLGFAKTLARHRLFIKYAIVLNMGTGNPKFQVYERVKSGGVRVTTEVKSKGVATQPTISPSSIDFEGFVPIKEEGPRKTQQIFEVNNQGWFDDCMVKLSTKLSTLSPMELDAIPVFAVVTGTVRQHYFKMKENRLDMDRQMHEMLSNMTGNRALNMKETSFFISQADEGKYEFAALEEVVQSVNPNTMLILGLGIGRGSTQLPYRSSVDQGVRVCGIAKGMGGKDPNNPLYVCGEEEGKTLENDTEYSKTMLYDILDNWKGPSGTHGLPALDDIRRQIVTCLAHGKIPVMGLKSGALIYYETLDEDQKKGNHKEVDSSTGY